MKSLEAVAVLIGFGLLIAGVALVYIPAALMVAGVLLIVSAVVDR